MFVIEYLRRVGETIIGIKCLLLVKLRVSQRLGV